MAKIFIEPSKARATLSQQQALERALRSLSQDVGAVRGGLRYKISGREAIDARLREAVAQINREAESTKAIRLGLEQIINRYEQTEKNNTERVKAEKTSIQQGGNGGGSSDGGSGGGGDDGNHNSQDWKDALKKILEELWRRTHPFLPGIINPILPIPYPIFPTSSCDPS